MTDRPPPPASPQSEALTEFRLLAEMRWSGRCSTNIPAELQYAAKRRCVFDYVRKLEAQVAGAPVSPTLTNAEKAAHWKKWCDELEGAPVSQADAWELGYKAGFSDLAEPDKTYTIRNPKVNPFGEPKP